MKHIRVTAIGGGSAQARLLKILLVVRALLRLQDIELHINSIVAVADDGGAAGRIRALFGGPALGDIINVMAATGEDLAWVNTMLDRYEDDLGELSGLKAGSLLFQRLIKNSPGGLPQAIPSLARAMQTQANVFPSTLESPTLCVKLEDGRVICGEHQIDEPKHDGAIQIIKAWLEPKVELNPEAFQAILDSDFIIGSAGDPYGSIAACTMVKGMPEAICGSQAKVGIIVPLFNRYGQSTDWSANRHIDFYAEQMNPAKVSAAFINMRLASAPIAELYAMEKESQVLLDKNNPPAGIDLYQGDYLDETIIEPQPGDKIRRSSKVARHGENLATDLKLFFLGIAPKNT